MTNSENFEYVFYFLFRRYLWRDNQRWNEPPLDSDPDKSNDVLYHGVRFEKDKRLFRRDVTRGEPLANWATHLQHSWQDICKIYAEVFGDSKLAQQYCQEALQGVTLLILDNSSIKHHALSVPVQGDSCLSFLPSYDTKPLFRLSVTGVDNQASCYPFKAETSAAEPLITPLRLVFDTSPYLAPLENNEAAANAVFLVYGFSYGGEWSKSIEHILLNDFSKQSLLSTVFTRLMMVKWQSTRIDLAAENIRDQLQLKNAYYADYLTSSQEARPKCARTRLLERQLQEMYSLNTQANFVISRIQGALQTLDINGDNLATRLTQIREAAQIEGGQLEFGSAPTLEWPSTAVPLLAEISRLMNKLQDHQAYIAQQLKYLDTLRDKWHLYLDNRKTNLGEYLNILGTIFILIVAGGTGLVTLNINKGLLGVTPENQFISLLIITILLVPIGWHFFKWLAKLFCCIFHGTWLNRWLCKPIAQWLETIEFFSIFKKR